MKELNERLRDYLNSAPVQKRIREEIKKNPQIGKSSGGGAESVAKAAAEELKDILLDVIDSNSILSPRAKEVFSDAVRSEVFFDDGVGWTANVYFDREVVARRSWYEIKYDFDVYLPVLFNNGYDAENYVYKKIDGEGRRSLRVRAASEFIQETAVEFRRRHNNDGLTLTYNPAYDSENSEWESANLSAGYF